MKQGEPRGFLKTWKFLKPWDKRNYCNCWGKLELITGFSNCRQHCTFLCASPFPFVAGKFLILGCLPGGLCFVLGATVWQGLVDKMRR